ncbi:hypothetical protein AAEO50_15290 [Rossellomorea oryzaecorticis]|uniref:Flp pilus-assembly TadG-like N-terminal domain-containing protein n=1 Tax=Rossellomorea oryzaecorticis TaxID=1396505 RepID=A0ABU9KFK7_9BACI
MNLIKNDRGHISILMIWLLLLTGLVIVFSVNIMGAFAVKQQTSTASQQAALTATDIIYDYTLLGVKKYDETLIGIGEGMIEGKSIEKKIKDRKEEYMWTRDISENKALRLSVNEILREEIPGNDKLRDAVKNEVNNAVDEIPSRVSNKLYSNNVSSTNYKVKLFDSDQRVVIEGTGEFNSVEADNFIGSFTKNIKQVSKGPRIPFIDELDFENRMISSY